MVIRYNTCDNCHHKSEDHDEKGKCTLRGCTCPGFKPHVG